MPGRNGAAAAAPAVAAPLTPPPAARAAAPRRSRRGLVLAVLVVLLGGVLAYGGARMLAGHTPVLAVARDVPAGQVITAADLVAAEAAADPNLAPVPAAETGRVVGQFARVPLLRGELLTAGQVGPSDGFTAGQQLVGLALRPGQFPARGLSPGERVLIVSTPGSGTAAAGQGGGAAAGTPAAAGDGPAAGGVAAVVADVGAASPASSVTVVDVRVPAAAGPGLARLSSTGNLAVIALPDAGG